MPYWAIGATGYLVIFGLWFAWREYAKPLYPTWLAVVTGVGGTLLGITVSLFDILAQDAATLASLVIWVGFIITGWPMIWLQARKEREFADEAQRRSQDTGELGSL